MRIGTRSVLFGAHQFLAHPLILARAWWKLYGFPWDLRLWVAFFVHDLGYLGKPDMDGEAGSRHPELGAKICGVFGRDWYEFCLYHSRYYAKRDGQPTSRLCVADKLAIVLEPTWFYLLRTRATGELREYRGQVERWSSREPITAYEHELAYGSDEAWFEGLKSYMRRWVERHKNGEVDTWTAQRDEMRKAS